MDHLIILIIRKIWVRDPVGAVSNRAGADSSRCIGIHRDPRNGTRQVGISSGSLILKSTIIKIAEHKFLIKRLETNVGDALEVDVKRLTNSLNADREVLP